MVGRGLSAPQNQLVATVVAIDAAAAAATAISFAQMKNQFALTSHGWYVSHTYSQSR